MLLSQLKLVNFKNYESLEVDFSPNVNCLVGDNGVGKTNLLDAVYHLSFGKSFFNPIDSQNIRHGCDCFAIHGVYNDGDERHTVSCVMHDGQKQMKWDGRQCKTLSEHVGRIPLVMVSPSDQQLIVGGSEVRRKFVDGVIAQTDRVYLDHLLAYQRAVEQRNRLLKHFFESRAFDASLLDVWDEQLVRHGGVLLAGRRSFLEQFCPIFERYFCWIAPETERCQLEYVSQCADADDFARLLLSNRSRDAHALFTTVGPHRDDLELMIGGFSVRRYGSQGQQKTLLLALKLAQFDYLHRYCAKKPILLLDDVFDKLDFNRVGQLLDLVAGDSFGQVFVTDTQQGRVEQLFSTDSFSVSPAALEAASAGGSASLLKVERKGVPPVDAVTAEQQPANVNDGSKNLE